MCELSLDSKSKRESYKRHFKDNWGNLNIDHLLNDIIELMLIFLDMVVWL